MERFDKLLAVAGEHITQTEMVADRVVGSVPQTASVPIQNGAPGLALVGTLEEYLGRLERLNNRLGTANERIMTAV
jgi:hypothetical protein